MLQLWGFWSFIVSTAPTTIEGIEEDSLRFNLHRDRIRDSVARQSNTNSSSFYPGFDEKTPKIDPQPLVGTPCTITATYNNCPLIRFAGFSATGTSLVNSFDP